MTSFKKSTFTRCLLAGAVFTAFLTPTSAYAQDDGHFDGGFVGVEAGIYGSGGYTSAQYGLNGGFRTQDGNGLVLGVEGILARTSFFDVGLTQGVVLGSAGMVFGDEGRNLVSVGAGYARVGASGYSVGAFASFVGYERAMGDSMSFRVRAMTYDFNDAILTVGVGFRF